ncbi:tyrosine-type recombinase/integrase [Hoeflea sp.]|uniref:tyrosine-type recombinase/integrase n=1 Tax=Hoeflea sp. TaxID=1940281 RepID=UPI003B0122C8
MAASHKRPPYLKVYTDRHGAERIYFRRRGYREIPLKTPLYSDAFWQSYEAAMTRPKPAIGASRIKPGSMNDVIVAYYGSPDFRTLKASTKTTYRGIIERFRKDHGEKSAARLQPRHIRRMMRDKSETPSAANNFLRILHLLMRQAIEMELREDDPTRFVRKIRVKTGGFRSWQERDIDAYIRAHPQGTRAHLALMLLLYTGLRRSDVVRVGPQHIRDGVLTIRQTKTGSEVGIPVHAKLKAAIADAPKDGMVFLKTAFGKPFTPAGFGNWFRDVTDQAGLKGLTAHGLRKAIARRLAEAGCSPHEIMAITGHQNLKEVVLYTAAANRRQMAQAAMERLNDETD